MIVGNYNMCPSAVWPAVLEFAAVPDQLPTYKRLSYITQRTRGNAPTRIGY